MNRRSGFTLMELLVIIGILSVLAAGILVGLNSARQKGRDARRISDMKQILLALELYYDTNGRYPNNADNDCSGWDSGYNGGAGSGDKFIEPLETGKFITRTPGDPVTTGNCSGYLYYKYSAGQFGYCPASLGPYFVLGVVNMESTGRPHPKSPGFSPSGCTKNWNGEFDWVTGKFEK